MQNASTDEVCCAYIMQNLLAATSTASAKVLIGPAACYTGIHTLAESVQQICALGRCVLTLCYSTAGEQTSAKGQIMLKK